MVSQVKENDLLARMFLASLVIRSLFVLLFILPFKGDGYTYKVDNIFKIDFPCMLFGSAPENNILLFKGRNHFCRTILYRKVDKK